MNKIDQILDEEAEAAETAEVDSQIRDDDPLPEGTQVTRGHGRSRTLQIRLNGDEYYELELLAKGKGLPTSTVARSLLLASLSPTDNITDAIRRAETALAQAQRLMEEKGISTS